MTFRIGLLAALLTWIPASHGTVVAMAGSTPQVAVNGVYPTEVLVQVLNERGQPVPNASIGFVIPEGLRTSAVTTAIDVCYIEPYLSCFRPTDANGMVNLGRFSGRLFDARVGIMTVNAERYGSVDIVFSEDGSQPIRLQVVSGDHQTATIGRPLATPVVLRAIRSDGSSVAGQQVGGVDTDANGYATLVPFAGWVLGDRAIQFSTNDTTANVRITASIEYTALNTDGSDRLHLQNLWWGGPSEDGWGMSIVQHDDRLFTVLYIYDNNGDPIWFPAFGTLRDTSLITPCVFGADNFCNGGATLYETSGTPFWSDAARQVRVATLGRLDLDFQGDDHAQLTAVTFGNAPPITPVPIGDAIARETLAPMDLTGSIASPVTGVADMWWGGPSEAGWGIAMIEQYGALVVLWFTYDDGGRPTWFIMPGGEWRDASTYAGAIYRTSGPKWFNGGFRRDLVRVQQVGQFSLQFIDSAHATFEYSLQGHVGSHALIRQEF
jgi:hypothetical protein